MEPGFFNMFMTMVSLRAQFGEATVDDGWNVLEWLKDVNRSTVGGMDWGLDMAPRTNGFESGHMMDWRVNYTREEARFRDFHPWTDITGNTLRSVYESLICVIAGAARAGLCENGVAQARQVIDIIMLKLLVDVFSCIYMYVHTDIYNISICIHLIHVCMYIYTRQVIGIMILKPLVAVFSEYTYVYTYVYNIYIYIFIIYVCMYIYTRQGIDIKKLKPLVDVFSENIHIYT